jgi:hypothetical protein
MLEDVSMVPEKGMRGRYLQCWELDGACLLELVASSHGRGALDGLL